MIVGVEASGESRDALRLGRQLADAEGAELHVTSVHTETVFYAGEEAMERDRDAYFERMIELAREEVGEPFTFHRVTEVSAPKGLTMVAEKLEDALLVIGSSHRGPFGRVLMGDVGARLASGTPCALAVTPRGWAADAPARIARVGIGYDASDESRAALAYGDELAFRLKASVKVIGVIPASVHPARGGFSDLAFWNLLRDGMDEKLAEAVGVVRCDEVSSETMAGFPADELTRASAELDLLVLGSRTYGPLRRALLGGTSFRVMRSAACPVLIVPRPGG